MRKRKEKKLLDWRDPEMPVLTMMNVQTTNPDGSVERKKEIWEITPAQRQELSQHCLNTSMDPHWRNDPTYFSKRSRKK